MTRDDDGDGDDDDDGDGDGGDGGDISDTGGFRYYGDVDDGDDGGVRWDNKEWWWLFDL